VDGLLVACVGSSDGALLTELRVGSTEGVTTIGDVDGTLVESNVVDSVGVLEGFTVDDDGGIVGEIVGDLVDGRNEGECEGVFVGSSDGDCVGSLEG